jgi:hypothetical protein
VATIKQLDDRLTKLETRFDVLLTLFGVVDEDEPPSDTEPTFSFEAGIAADDDVYRVIVHGPVAADTVVFVRKDADDKDLGERVRIDGSLLRAEIPLADLDEGEWTTFVRRAGKDDEPIDTFEVTDEQVPPELLS